MEPDRGWVGGKTGGSPSERPPAIPFPPTLQTRAPPHQRQVNGAVHLDHQVLWGTWGNLCEKTWGPLQGEGLEFGAELVFEGWMSWSPYLRCLRLGDHTQAQSLKGETRKPQVPGARVQERHDEPGTPTPLPRVKLLAVLQSAIVVVAYKIPHLHLPGTGPGNVVPLDDHIFQGAPGRAGAAQPPPQGLQQQQPLQQGEPAEGVAGGSRREHGARARPAGSEGEGGNEELQPPTSSASWLPLFRPSPPPPWLVHVEWGLGRLSWPGGVAVAVE